MGKHNPLRLVAHGRERNAPPDVGRGWKGPGHPGSIRRPGRLGRLVRNRSVWGIGAAALAILLFGIAILAAQALSDLRSMAGDVAEQRVLVEAQLEVTEQLLEAQQELLEQAAGTRGSTETMEEQIATLIELTRQMLEEVREMNQRTGGAITP